MGEKARETVVKGRGWWEKGVSGHADDERRQRGVQEKFPGKEDRRKVRRREVFKL